MLITDHLATGHVYIQSLLAEVTAEGTVNMLISRNTPVWMPAKYNVRWRTLNMLQAFTRRVWCAWGLQDRHELHHPNLTCDERTTEITK